MQIDFHHAVTYVLARLADFPHEQAIIIAYSAQYVDDAQNRGTIQFDNGNTYDHIASAHAVYDVQNNLWPREDFRVWVPFHFLPGNNGKLAGEGQEFSVEQRLLCQPDSLVAADMCRAALATRGHLNSLHRLGITTHVYADTWAHKRFSGVMSLINESHDETKENLIERIETTIADIVGLGHGAVSVHPDQPFRIWKYRDSNGMEVMRNNPDEFIGACERIFDLHIAYRGEGGTDRKIQTQDHALLYDSLLKFDSTDPQVRHQQWLDLLQTGSFSFGALTGGQIQDLQYRPKGVGSWKYDALGTEATTDTAGQRFPFRDSFQTSNWRLFHEALKDHQADVLQRILPAYGLPNSAEALLELRGHLN
jgi:hypothetical protein